MSNSVTIILNRLQGCDSKTITASSGSQKIDLHLNTSSTLHSIQSGTLLNFSSSSSDGTQGISSLSIDQLSQSPSTIWLKFKSSSTTSQDQKAKITVSKVHNAGRLDDCPYLQLLAEGKADDRVSSRVNQRGEAEVKTLRINFEADAPVRLGTEIKTYEPESLADLDSVRLESIGGDQIKKQIKALAEEIKKLGISSVKNARDELLTQVDSRVAQEESFEKFTENAVLELTEMISNLWALEDQRAALQLEINSSEHLRNQTEIEIDESKALVGAIQREILMLKAERLRFRDLENLLESSKAFHHSQSENLLKLKEKFEDSKVQTAKVAQNSSDLIEKLEKETQEFIEKLRKVSENEAAVTENNQKLKSHLSDLKVKLSQQKNFEALDPSKSSDQRYAGLNKLQAIQSEAFEYDQESKLKFKASLKQKHSAYDSLLAAYTHYEDAQHKNLEKQVEKFLVSNELTYLEQSCCIVGDVSNLTETLSKFQKFYSNTSKSSLKFLDLTTNEVLKETDTIKNECNKIGDIMNGVLEKDSETENVKAIMAEIKERHPPYIPTLDDPIDVALFEYIKSCDEPIPIPFTREEQGIYLFGTKRVFLKLENGNLAIRIGGGFTSIQNFIEIYTSIELERQEEAIEEAVPQFKNSQARFVHSPQKGMSPLRAARILQGAVEVQVSGTPVKVQSPIRKTPVKR
jgi:hypothetical protein